MKKIIIPLFCALLLIASASCVNNQGDYIQSKPSETETLPSGTQTEAMPPKVETMPPVTETMPPETETMPPETEEMPPEKEEMPKETETIPPVTGSIPSIIPANESVNVAWGGCMCEAAGFIYYVSGAGDKQKIVRMEQDGSNPVTVTEGEYSCLSELTADDAYLYFVSTVYGDDQDTIYRLPLGGGEEQKIANGNVDSLQNANGKLYWVDDFGDDTPAKINRINSDGSVPQTLATIHGDEFGTHIEFLVAGESIYYITGLTDINDFTEYSDLYRMDMDGGNAVKLNRSRLGWIDKLFYDQGKLYFLAEDLRGDLFDSLQTLGANGKAITLLKSVGFFPQDEGEVEYCGISNGMFYHFDYPDTDETYDTNDDDDNTKYILFDLYRFDLKTKKDTVLFHNVKICVGILCSIRGKSIKNNGVAGFYILGNDIYYSSDDIPWVFG